MKKPVLVLTILLFLVSALSAEPSSVRIGYVTSFDKTAFDAVFESALSLVASKSVPAFNEAAEMRLASEGQKKADAEYHRSLKSLDFDAERKPVETEACSGFSIEKLEVPEYASAFLLSETEADYFMRKNGIDVLFLIEGEEEGPLLDYTISCFIGGRKNTLLSRLSVLHNSEAEFLPILNSLRSHYLPSYVVVTVEGGEATLEIRVDDKDEIPISNVLLLSPGLHTFTYSAFGAIAKSEVLYLGEGEDVVLSPVLEKADFSPVLFTSIPSFAAISVMGGEEKAGYSFSDEQTRPFAVSAKAPGFANLGLQISSPAIYNCLELKPEWMEEKSRLKTAKDEMYRALRNTLIAFGSDVAVYSLEKIYPEFAPSSLPFKVTFTSVAVISLFDFLYKCGRYYRTAENTYY